MSKNIKVCACGKEYTVADWQLKNGKGKYCSKKCMYEFRVMPKRGKGVYKLVKENPTVFKKGERRSIATEFKKGTIPYNWKGENAGYHALHDWVQKYKGKAEICEKCSSTEHVQWANKSHEYKRELDDFAALCKKCHMKHDKSNWGAGTKKYPELKRKKKVI